MAFRAAFAVLIMIVSALIGTGCMPPDRSGEARNLEGEIAAMPGVAGAEVRYSNDFENGSELHVGVVMSQADDAQIAAVITRVNDLKKNDFQRYRQYEAFTVGDALTLKRDGVLDPDQVVADARLLRRLRGDLPVGVVEWSRYRTESRLEIRSVTETMRPLVAALAVLDAEPATTVYVRSDDPPAAPTWEVDAPTGMGRKDFENLLGSLALRAYYVHTDRDAVVGLDVYVAEKESSFDDLVSVIRTIGPTKERPLKLAWTQAAGPDNRHRFQGSLTVPSCPPAEGSAAEESLTPEAVQLQRRMRKEFADC